MGLPSSPNTRKEVYLSNIAGQGTSLPTEPITREEEYLDYIAKNGGGGGGTGDGDMKKSIYDDDLAVASAGGIKAYTASAISGKVDKVNGKGLSTNDYDDTAKTIVDGVNSALGNKVSKSNTAGLLKNDGTVDQTSYATAASVNAIKDGTDIDSFGDVESALAGKMNHYYLEDNVGFYFDAETGHTSLHTNTTNSITSGSRDIPTSGAVYSALDDKVSKSNTAGLLKNDGTVDTSTYLTSIPLADADSIGGIRAGGQYDSYFEVNGVTGRLEPTFHTITPTSGGNGFANSADVYDAVKSAYDLTKDTVGWSGKNLFPKFTESHSGQGVTFTADSNGVVTCSGTATATSIWRQDGLILKAGTYKLSGGDNIGTYNDSSFNALIGLYDSSTSAYLAPDTGTVDEYTFATDKEVKPTLRIQNGVNSSAYTFYPMLRKVSIIDGTYEPCRNTTAVPRDEQTILGAKNFIKVIASSQTVNDVVFTVYSDGSVKAHGTATGGDAVFRLSSNRQNQNDEVIIPNGTYYLSGSVGGSDTTYYMNIRHQGTGAIATQTNSQKLVTLDNTTGGTYGFNIIIKSGATVENLMFYPMLRLSTDPDRTFAPYAMTNKELTENLFYKNTDLRSTDDLDNITITGLYYIYDSTPVNAPESVTYCTVIVNELKGVIQQTIIKSTASAGSIYVRTKSGSPLAWKPWVKFTGTVVS